MNKDKFCLGIHHSKGSYSDGLIEYCENNNISYKKVDAYSNSIIHDLEDCQAFVWHFFHNNPKDVLFAKQLLFSLEISGKTVFPNFKTCWHFDDKVGQKYLLEALQLPLIPTFIAYSKLQAIEQIKNNEFPIVFKLRGGAGSYNVSLLKTKQAAIQVINKAFGKGFRQFNPVNDFLFSYKKLIKDKFSFQSIIKLAKSFSHFLLPYDIERSLGREKGYFYFQQFIPDCKFDYRVQYVGENCYAMQRFVRSGDFRASGGGNINYDGSKIPFGVILLAKKVKEKVGMQIMAIDILEHENEYSIAEISYAFAIDEGECDFGYYNAKLEWVPGPFNPYEFMIKTIIKTKND